MTNIYPKLYLLKSWDKLKMYFSLLMALCFSSISAQTPCNYPINPIVTSLTTSSGTITWTQPSPVPLHGYEYYYTKGTGTATTSGTTTTNSLTISNVASNVNVYVRIRPNCVPDTDAAWSGTYVFTTLTAGSGCPSAPYGLSPAATFTPQYTQLPETVSTTAYAGQYSNINVVANRQHIFSTSVSGDYITITADNPNTILAHGPAPLTWNSETTGVVRYYVNTNASCGTQQTARSRYITAKLIPSDCPLPSNFYTSAISSTGAVLHWDYTGSIHHSYYVSTSNVLPGINVTPTGSSANAYQAVTGLTPNTTYYYWVRSDCGSDLSNWAYGGSFSTPVSTPVGCTITTYGQNPTTTYTPGCFGNAEIISTNTLAGEYSNVNILPNKTYTFISSVPTDFITIYDNEVNCVYASGITPLVWSSGANTALVRFSLHASSTCVNQYIARTKSIICQDAATCAAPSSLNIPSITNSAAVINWASANPSPANGYQYYYTTSSTAPTNGTPPSGNNASTTLNLTGLNANTTYHIWIRSNCGSGQSNWVFGNSFTTVGTSTSGCVTAIYGLYPPETFVPACFGITENIVTDGYASEYAYVAISPNRQYTFASSISSDYITISNADASVIYVTGFTPLVWSSGTNSGTMRFYLHSNAACGSSEANRTKTIICQAPVVATCNNPSALTAVPTASSAVLNWSPSSPAPSNGYQYYYGTAATAPNSSATPSGSAPAANVTLNGLVSNTTYYFWVRSNCGSSQGEWVAGGSFTTLNNNFCNTAIYGQFPSSAYMPSCSGSPELIVSNAYAGEYCLITITANRQYTFSSSVATDYITIATEDGTTLLANGITPLVWNSAAISGNIRYYLHTNSACGSQDINRTRFIACASGSSCGLPTNLHTSNITSNSCLVGYTPSASAGATYDIYFGPSSTAPSAGTAPSGNIADTEAFLFNLLANTTYYYWVRTNCGTSASAWISGGSLTTNAFLSCNSATYGLYPEATFTPVCSGSNESIATDTYAGEFAKVAIASNKQYRFTSSMSTDFITITNEAGNVFLASGASPLVWNSGSNSGIIRYFIHANNSCATQNQNRTRSISCSNILGDADFSLKGIKIYPNPTSGTVNITGRQIFEKIEVINHLGQRVKVFLTHSDQAQIDIHDLAVGIYFVKIYAGNEYNTYKIVKD